MTDLDPAALAKAAIHDIALTVEAASPRLIRWEVRRIADRTEAALAPKIDDASADFLAWLDRGKASLAAWLEEGKDLLKKHLSATGFQMSPE